MRLRGLGRLHAVRPSAGRDAFPTPFSCSLLTPFAAVPLPAPRPFSSLPPPSPLSSLPPAHCMPPSPSSSVLPLALPPSSAYRPPDRPAHHRGHESRRRVLLLPLPLFPRLFLAPPPTCAPAFLLVLRCSWPSDRRYPLGWVLHRPGGREAVRRNFPSSPLPVFPARRHPSSLRTRTVAVAPVPRALPASSQLPRP